MTTIDETLRACRQARDAHFLRQQELEAAARALRDRAEKAEAEVATMRDALSDRDQLGWKTHLSNCSDCQRADVHQRWLLTVLCRNAARAESALSTLDREMAQ